MGVKREIFFSKHLDEIYFLKTVLSRDWHFQLKAWYLTSHSSNSFNEQKCWNEMGYVKGEWNVLFFVMGYIWLIHDSHSGSRDGWKQDGPFVMREPTAGNRPLQHSSISSLSELSFVIVLFLTANCFVVFYYYYLCN